VGLVSAGVFFDFHDAPGCCGVLRCGAMTATYRPIALPQWQPQNHGPIADPLGRGIGYLRLSLTKACSMRCLYCRPKQLDHPRGEPVLTPPELEQLTEYLVRQHGVSKVRLTGGDPTSRPELIEIIERIGAIDGITDLAMTTNGLTLERDAARFLDAGLHRVNVSIDSLDPQRFAQLTGVDALDRVLRGVERAQQVGLNPVKLNTVVVRGHNLDDLPALMRFAVQRGLELRFIELMPMGPLGEVWHERYVPEAEMKAQLHPHVLQWTELPQGAAAARKYRVTLNDGRVGTIGFITPMSCNFCEQCNRLRIAADGSIFPCLMDTPRGSLLHAVRDGFDAEAVDGALRRAYADKQEVHPDFGHATMTHIGG